MAHARQSLGALGERLAAEYLRRRGLRVVATNVRTPFGELDLIARDAHTVFSVEVKTRRDRRGVPPLEQVTVRKQQRLTAATEWWVAQHDWTGPVVIACVGVDCSTTPPTFEWISDISA